MRIVSFRAKVMCVLVYKRCRTGYQFQDKFFFKRGPNSESRAAQTYPKIPEYSHPPPPPPALPRYRFERSEFGTYTGHYVVLLGKTIYSHMVFLYTQMHK